MTRPTNAATATTETNRILPPFRKRCLPTFACASVLCASVLLGLIPGCGTVKKQLASDQLLVSDAVDRSVSRLDFSPLAGQKVYLDTSFLKHVGSVGFVNSAYITSSLREQMISYECTLQEKRGDADYIVEVRVGALGTDGHETNYGLPANNALSTTAALVAETPFLPSVPELSLAKKDERRAAAKIGVFAYHRESKRPVWRSGNVRGESLAKSTWVFGAGPFQKGTIFEGSEFSTSPVPNVVPLGGGSLLNGSRASAPGAIAGTTPNLRYGESRPYGPRGLVYNPRSGPVSGPGFPQQFSPGGWPAQTNDRWPTAPPTGDHRIPPMNPARPPEAIVGVPSANGGGSVPQQQYGWQQATPWQPMTPGGTTSPSATATPVPGKGGAASGSIQQQHQTQHQKPPVNAGAQVSGGVTGQAATVQPPVANQRVQPDSRQQTHPSATPAPITPSRRYLPARKPSSFWPHG